MSLPCLNTVNAVKLTYVIDGVSTTVYLVECGVVNGNPIYWNYNEGNEFLLKYVDVINGWNLNINSSLEYNLNPFGEWIFTGYDSVTTELTTIQNECIRVTADSEIYNLQNIGTADGSNVYYQFNDISGDVYITKSGVWGLFIVDSQYTLPTTPEIPISDAWEYQSGTEYTTVVTENCDCVLTLEQELIMSYKLTVWKEQCKFAECVLQYLLNLQFGIFNCEALENLKNKRRILNILNCYDARDILNNTTDYNTITYTEIKELLNYL